jgi:SWI/SNF-related matrix-associated actin-dependent regulator 1 of chromatin subfamily A
VRLFIGNIQAAGLGITLTAASRCIFAELSWVPAELSQAEDRLHRIGTLDSVTVQHLVLEGSLDAMMVHVLFKKQRILDAVLEEGLQK